MKNILIALLTLLAFNLKAQDYSTVYFTTDIGIKIFINDQSVGSITTKEALAYKVYSEGRLEITVVGPIDRRMLSVDVKNGNKYYIAVPPSKVISSDRGEKIVSKKTIVTKEEDANNPLIVNTNKPQSKGPKQGTCFLISKQGYLLTNYHVINNAKNVQIKGIGNDFSTLYGADVVAYDIALDLALLKLKNQNITFEDVPYGLTMNSSPQGTKSFVLGYPLTAAMGEEIKVTEGLISAKSGYKGTISQYQFSAPVQPGNSGSPLFNDAGDVIGVISAKLTGAEGAGYAIKSQYVSTFLKLVESVQIEDNKSMLASLSLADKISKLKGNIFIVNCE